MFGLQVASPGYMMVNRGESEQSGDRQSQPELDEAAGRVNGGLEYYSDYYSNS